MNKLHVIFYLLAFQITAIFATDTLVMKSDYLSSTDTVLIFCPENHSPDSVFPVVYLLHGYGGNYSSFSKLLELDWLANHYRFIIVCPDGLKDSWYFDSPLREKSLWERFYFEELYPKINRSYPADTANIFITGYSMGGHGAMYLFLRNTAKFRAAGASSGVMDLNQSRLKKTSIASHLGAWPDSAQKFLQYSSITYLENLTKTDKEIIIDCGTEDYLQKANQNFYEKCMELELPVYFMEAEGGHNAQYWKESFLWHFSFFEKKTKRISKN
ncbi:MAG: prolyl oligopeptidase family serine peptidase [Bacteroidales bacterium]|nr:prolyl oligopeptidase family serine peptidase [Bacteroidales bacterium]